MAITGVLRPGYIQIRVLDIEEAIVHYRDRLGLTLVERAPDGRAYLKALDEFDHHSIVLRPSDEAGMDFFAFKVLDDATLTSFTDRLSAYGITVEHREPGSQPGLGRVVSFVIPSGHQIELYAHMELAENGPQTKNPNVWQEEPRGMRATRFDHALLYGPSIPDVVKVFTEVLGFELAECILDPDGNVFAGFLSCSNKAHDVAFVHNPEPARFHHASFYLNSWNDVGHAADILTHYDMAVDIGPTRHGITRGQTIYFWDPSGNRNEVFSGGYTYYPDSPRRVWTMDQIAKSIFYYERELNEAFLSVYT